MGLYAENAGFLGALLETAVVDPVLTVDPTRPDPADPLVQRPFTSASFSGTTVLTAGTSYWLALVANDDTTLSTWIWDRDGPLVARPLDRERGLADSWDFITTPTQNGLFRLQGPDQLQFGIPEPSAVAFLGFGGLLGLIAVRRTRRA